MNHRIQQISGIMDRLAPEISTLALTIHAHPELSNEEVLACRLHCDLLESHGFSVERGFLDIPTAYRALYRSEKPGPALAFLAEYDALPELGHACGHNLIGALACAAGLCLKELIDELGGSVYVFGCPGEETNGAKVDMAKQACFDRIDVAMMAHPHQSDGFSSTTMAIDALQFEYFGRTAHAASCPEEGINALSAAIRTFNKVEALRKTCPDRVRIHGVITHGGLCPNVIPDYAAAQFYVRDTRRRDLDPLTAQVIRCAEEASAEIGTRLQVTPFEYSNDDLLTNQALSRLFSEKLREVGFTGTLLTGINGGSSDVGNASQRCPMIQPWFGLGEGHDLPLHTREFAAVAGSEAALEKMLLYARALALTGVHLLEHPEAVAEIRSEFLAATAADQATD